MSLMPDVSHIVILVALGAASAFFVSWKTSFFAGGAVYLAMTYTRALTPTSPLDRWEALLRGDIFGFLFAPPVSINWTMIIELFLVGAAIATAAALIFGYVTHRGVATNGQQ